MWWTLTALAAEPTGAPLAETLEPHELTSAPTELVVVPRRSKKAPIVVQYSDWRCPHCLVALPRVMAAARAGGAEVRFRNFPLDGECNPAVETVTGERCALARASVCAAREGRFDAFVEHASANDPDGLERWVRDPTIGVCMDDPSVGAAVREQAMAGARDGLVGTPTFFVRVGKRWVEASDVSVVERLLAP